MRRALLALLLLVLALPAAARGQEITAPAAIAIEATTGDVIFAKNPDERLPIASTTKLMTALVTLEQAKLGETVVAPRYRSAPAESLFSPKLVEGEELSVADMLRGLLMVSANDAAVALADHVSGGIRPFVAEMNRRAEELGLENTHYANPIGLDSTQNYSSARDLALLTRELRKSQFFRTTVNTVNTTLRTDSRGRPSLTNRNLLLQREGWVTGVKTGQTSLAGNVLVASGAQKGVPVVAVVIGADGADTAADEAFALMEFALSKFQVRQVLTNGTEYALVPIKFRPGADLPVTAARSIRRVVRKEATTTEVNDLPAEVEGPLRVGDRVGTRHVLLDGEEIASIPLVATVEVPRAGFGRETQDFLTRPGTLGIFGVVLLAAAGLLSRRRTTPREREESPA